MKQSGLLVFIKNLYFWKFMGGGGPKISGFGGHIKKNSHVIKKWKQTKAYYGRIERLTPSFIEKKKAVYWLYIILMCWSTTSISLPG